MYHATSLAEVPPLVLEAVHIGSPGMHKLQSFLKFLLQPYITFGITCCTVLTLKTWDLRLWLQNHSSPLQIHSEHLFSIFSGYSVVEVL
uniref:Uncharacterized protein n=1 Tax=Arundo donax TaxID=35708 RepID=A0A0A9DM65_ARUDO